MLSFSLAALAAASALTCPTGLHRAADGKDQAVVTVRPNGSQGREREAQHRE